MDKGNGHWPLRAAHLPKSSKAIEKAILGAARDLSMLYSHEQRKMSLEK